MLDVTILKVKHGGKTPLEEKIQARKLIPYIKRSDVFSPEYACLSKERAEKLELEWHECIKSDDLAQYKAQLAQKPLYGKVVSGICFSNKIPLYYSERFANENFIDELHRLRAKRLDAVHLAKCFFRRNDLSGVVESMRKSFNFGNLALDLRDSEIARNLETAEEYLRSKYPKIGLKLKLVLFVGYLHQPEKYFSGAEVVNLVNRKHPEFTLMQQVLSGAPLSEMNSVILEYAKSVGWENK